MGKASSSKKIQRVQRAGVKKRPGQRRPMGFPLAMAAIVAAGSVLAFFARDSRVNAQQVAPEANVDHWHVAIGVYDCNQYLPAIPQAPDDPLGIHTHGDGLAHIHPFVAAASGRNAKFSVLADNVGITFGKDSATLPAGLGGKELKGGKTCKDDKGKNVEARLVMLQWPPQATENVDPEVVTSNLNTLRFTEDGAAWALALLPKTTKVEDVPLPPSVAKLQTPLAAEGGNPRPDTGSSTTVPGAPESAPETTAPASTAPPTTAAP